MRVASMRSEQEATGVGGPQDALRPACANREAWPELNELQVECCGICHDVYPQHDLRWAPMKGGEVVLVCCAVERALSSSPANLESEAMAVKLLGETFGELSDE